MKRQHNKQKQQPHILTTKKTKQTNENEKKNIKKWYQSINDKDLIGKKTTRK